MADETNHVSHMAGPEARGFSREERKEIVKEAIKEWMDEQFARFGRWSLYTILAAAVAGVAYVTLFVHGWIKP